MPTVPSRRGQDVSLPVSLVTTDGGTDPHVLRLDVTQPDGEPSSIYSKDVRLKSSGGSITIPFALNDQVGKWRIRICDVATGTATTAEIILQ